MNTHNASTEEMQALMDSINMEGIGEITQAIKDEGYVLQDFLEISDDHMEAMYAKAFFLTDQGLYEQGEELFTTLCRLNHYEGRFWIGLGVCRQMQKNYKEAVKAFAMAGTVDVENPVPGLHAAECFLQLGDFKSAESGALATLHWAGDKTEYQTFKLRAEIILENLKEKQGEQK